MDPQEGMFQVKPHKRRLLTPKYYADEKAGELMQLPADSPIKKTEAGMQKLIAVIYNPKAIEDMGEPVEPTTPANELNENFSDYKFQKLWNEINPKYVYTVHYDSEELIDMAITSRRNNLNVTKLQYVMMTGEQDRERVTEFGGVNSKTRELTVVSTFTVPYHVVGDIT